jgi:hypothetical protein
MNLAYQVQDLLAVQYNVLMIVVFMQDVGRIDNPPYIGEFVSSVIAFRTY